MRAAQSYSSENSNTWGQHSKALTSTHNAVAFDHSRKFPCLQIQSQAPGTMVIEKLRKLSMTKGRDSFGEMKI